MPDRFGGVKVAIVSLLIEAVGLRCSWQAPMHRSRAGGRGANQLRLLAYLPALGVEVVKRVSPQVRGTALGGYAAFSGYLYGVTGPLTGLFATLSFRRLFFPSSGGGNMRRYLGILITLVSLRKTRGPLFNGPVCGPNRLGNH